MIRVLSVFGTRPEAIKMAPVLHALGRRPGIASRVCVTAQHRGLLDDMLGLFGIVPDHDLDLMRSGQTASEVAGAILTRLPPILAEERPDLVLVHGDTVTSTAAAWAASLTGVAIGHVEAGLRSGRRDLPRPEELNRRQTGLLANLHFAPTPRARAALLAEGVPAAAIALTGNSGIDALLAIRRRLRIDAGFRSRAEAALPALDPARRLILVTAHRRENEAEMPRIAAALAELARRDDIEIVFPMHPKPAVREPVERLLGGRANVRLVAALGYASLLLLIERAALILSDSGGLQEEAPTLGRPLLVLRDVTERPEAIEAGAARLTGTDPAMIVAEAVRLLDNGAECATMAQPRLLFGDGRAGRRIADTIERWGSRVA